MNPAPAPLAALLACAFLALPAQARDCAAPPVRSAEQAICYANRYAEKNDLPHGQGVTRKVSKSKKVWSVRHNTTKPDGSRGPGWEVEIDIPSGTPTRFISYKWPAGA